MEGQGPGKELIEKFSLPKCTNSLPVRGKGHSSSSTGIDIETKIEIFPRRDTQAKNVFQPKIFLPRHIPPSNVSGKNAVSLNTIFNSR